MKTPAEGIQIPINTATKAQLRAFANHLGCTTSNFDKEAGLRKKIADSGFEGAHIIAFENAPTATARAKAIAAGDEVAEPMVNMTIHTQEGAGGKRPVFVACNGKAMLIPRNKRCDVKVRYLHVLENAIETKFEYDEEVKANVPRELPSYPFQVHTPANEEDIKAYHEWYARDEARKEAA